MGETSNSRGNWGSWLEFLFSTIGCLVGLGNVWRFPYVCYTNGGAAFLIPYLLAMAVLGVPMFFLEMVVSQYSNLGPGRVWIVCPLFRGIGFSMVILTSIVSLYYNVIISWALYYLAMSFRNPLPWASCRNDWNTDPCIPVGIELDQAAPGDPTHQDDNLTSWTFTTSPTSPSTPTPPSESDVASMTSVQVNMTLLNVTTGMMKAESSVVQFWTNHVLQNDGHSISDLGDVRWQLLLCLMATWTAIFLCLFKDIKTSGKVVYVAAVLPYVVLLALLIRGCLLPGAVDGVRFFLVPQWHRLLDWRVWLAATSQVFYSAGIAWGGVSTLASFNRFHNNVYRDAIVLPVLDALTSVFAGFVIFVYLGFMAHVQDTTVDKVVTQGTGLTFIAYPDALASMPLPQLWAVLFFLVLFTVGMDSQMVHVQTITSAVVDTWPRFLGHRKRWVTLAVCILGTILGLPFITQGGQYVLNLCDSYVASVSLMLVAFGETVVLSWIYGSNRLYDDIALMIGYRLNPVWHVFWRYISPAFILVTWTLGMVGWKSPADMPQWTVGLGWVIAIVPLLPIPILALQQLCLTPGTLRERLVASVRPSPEWKPAKSQHDGDQENGQSLKPMELLLQPAEPEGSLFKGDTDKL